MLPQPARGAALVMVVLTLLPGALATHDPSRPLDIHKPDLFPASVGYTGTDERTPAKLCFDVYNFAPANQGIAGFFEWLIRVDQVVNGSAYLYREVTGRSQEPLAGGDYVTFCTTMELPYGRYRAYASVDTAGEVDEENEGNNVQMGGSSFTVRDRPRPNLQLESYAFTIGPGDGRDGVPQIFRVRVVNRGAVKTTATTLIVRDETGLIGSMEVRPLVRGEAMEAVFETDPGLRTPGAFTAIAIVDPDNLIHESNEADNFVSKAYTIRPHPSPDLVVHEVKVNGTLIERRGLRLEAVVGNVGNKSAGTMTVRFDIDGMPVANQTLLRLAAGENRTLVFPFYLTSGNHTLRIQADPELKVLELSDANNVRETLVAIEEVPVDVRFPNLVVDRLSALPDDPGPGEVVTVNAYVRNIGERPSDNATVAIVLDGVRIGEVRIPPIEPDRYYSALFESANFTVGDHALRAYVDALAEVKEIHEDDNNDTIFLTIRGPRVEEAPDLPPAPPVQPPVELPPDATPAVPPGQEPDPAEEVDEDAPLVEITQVSVATRQVPGGLKGRITVALRNPRLEALGRMTLTFRVDGEPVKEVLLQGLEAAGTSGTTSGEVDLPPGEHEVVAELRVLGQQAPVVTSATRYSESAGEKGVPGPGLALVLLGVAALALRRKKADD